MAKAPGVDLFSYLVKRFYEVIHAAHREVVGALSFLSDQLHAVRTYLGTRQ